MTTTLPTTTTALETWFQWNLPALQNAVASADDPARKAARVAGVLGGRLPTTDILTPEQLAGDPDKYQQHVLYVEPGGAFSVTALVWRPGQETSIHDHVCWCTVGVLKGVEHEVLYNVETVAGRDLLIEGRHTEAPVGSVSYFAPPGDIHRVRNISDEVAVSLHVYGADISNLGTSVRRIYT